MDSNARVRQRRIVYGFFQSDKLIYIGSSSIPIDRVEYNHRNAYKMWPEEGHTRFRTMIKSLEPSEGSFKILLELDCTRPVIEGLEGQLIRSFNTPFNDDRDPVESSKSYGRY